MIDGAIASAVVTSLGYGLGVALIVAGLRWLWRPSAATEHVLACAGQWVIALAFLSQLGALVGSGPAPLGSTAAQTNAASMLAADAWLPDAWAPFIAVAWALGVGVGVLRSAGAWWVVRRWRAEAVALGEPWRARVASVAQRLGLARLPALAVSARIDSPVVIGVLRPVVLLPAALLGPPATLTLAQLDALIAHELAHLVRRDPWLAAIQHAIEVVLFFNPAVWWLSRLARRTREEATDDRAVHGGADPLVLARALVELRAVQVGALALAATDGSLRTRVQRLATRARGASSAPTGPRSARSLGVALVLLLAVRPDAADSAPMHATARADVPAARGSLANLPAAVRRFEAEIVAAAEHHDLDPRLVAIVAFVESGGDPHAESPLGARGLMQLMPATAAAAARAHGLPDASPERLADPAYNLELGAAVLAEQLRTFGAGARDRAAIERAAAAYNAGPTAVRRWLDDGTPLPAETERYRRRVGALWST